MRVPNDESKVSSAFRRLMKVGEGLTSLKSAVFDYDPLSLIGAFKSLSEAYKH